MVSTLVSWAPRTPFPTRKYVLYASVRLNLGSVVWVFGLFIDEDLSVNGWTKAFLSYASIYTEGYLGEAWALIHVDGNGPHQNWFGHGMKGL